jgi:hypothetical protein
MVTVEVFDPASTGDFIENTSPNSSSFVASHGYLSDRVENTILLLLFAAIT